MGPCHFPPVPACSLDSAGTGHKHKAFRPRHVRERILLVEVEQGVEHG